MDHDGDIAALLPDAPRPARRDAAIDEAMRRFDARGDPQRAAAARPTARQPGRTARFMRPQFGALVATVLLVVVAVPVWMARDRSSPPAAEKSMASNVATSPSPVPAARPAASPAVAGSAKPAPDAEPRPEPPLTGSAPAELAESRQAAPPVIRPQPAVQAADAIASLAPEATRQEKVAAPPPGGNAGFAQGGAPPPVAAIGPAKSASAPALADVDAAKARANSDEQVVVTARRAAAPSAREAASPRKRGAANQPLGRGDWNACTVNDPVHRLDACRKLFDPGAPGPAGRAAAHLADGLALAWAGDLDGAIARFDQAVAQSPRLAFAYLNRGLAYERKGDVAKAMADLDRAVRHAPGAARNYYNRSLLLRRLGDDVRADADADRAIELDARYRAVIR